MIKNHKDSKNSTVCLLTKNSYRKETAKTADDVQNIYLQHKHINITNKQKRKLGNCKNL